eukprot:g26455.t1
MLLLTTITLASSSFVWPDSARCSVYELDSTERIDWGGCNVDSIPHEKPFSIVQKLELLTRSLGENRSVEAVVMVVDEDNIAEQFAQFKLPARQSPLYLVLGGWSEARKPPETLKLGGLDYLLIDSRTLAVYQLNVYYQYLTQPMWAQGKSYPPPNEKVACSWHSYKDVKLCLSPKDMISQYIRREGIWQDCETLVDIFNRLRKRNPGHNHTVIDVGANIGACTVALLLEGARVISFEPHPLNLFFLTSTIMSLPAEMRARSMLFPYGAGEHFYVDKIYYHDYNPGNSVIGKRYGDALSDGGLVQIGTLDHLLSFTGLERALIMKIDVQGFEVSVLNGASGTFRANKVHFIKTELAPVALKQQGQSALSLCKKLIASGFKLINGRTLKQCSVVDAGTQEEELEAVVRIHNHTISPD